jgi:transposase
MMGRHSWGQENLFYAFDLDKHIPADHLLRAINQVLDFSDLRTHLEPYYSKTGRPSIDPELMIRMLLIGYCFGIRSERKLCEEIHLNLAYRWFCHFDLEDQVPDHSTFSKNRHGRFREADLFRHVFEGVVERCMKQGLVKGEGFAVDASLVKADANRQRAKPGNEQIDWGDKNEATRAVKEYLAALEQEQTCTVGQPKGQPKSISLTDPAASWTAAAGRAFFAYSTNYLVDLSAGIIVDVQATPALRPAELEATKTMIERVEQRFALTPRRRVGDTAYGSASMLHWIVEYKGIEPHVPVWDKSERQDNTFSSSAFKFDAQANRYECPAGKFLKPAWRSKKKNPYRYRASLYDCQDCPLKPQCCPNTPIRKIDRSPYESARDAARTIAGTKAYQQSRNERKKVEMLFAHLKRILKLDRLRLRGRSGAQDEFLLAATAQNLRRLAMWFGRASAQPSAAPA